jgi:hypothetical protein
MFVPPSNINISNNISINNDIDDDDNNKENNKNKDENKNEIIDIQLNIFDQAKHHLNASNLEVLREFSSKSGEGIEGVTETLLDILITPSKGLPPGDSLCI